MSIRHEAPLEARHRAAYGALAGTVVLVALVAVRAWTVSPLPEAAGGSSVVGIPELPEAPAPRLARVVQAVEADPFHPSRTGPAARYLLPEDEGSTPRTAMTQARSGRLELVGTAVSAGGGFAMCQLGDDPPRIVRVGEAVGGYTLRSVDRGEARFTREDGTSLTLRVPGVASDAESTGTQTENQR